MKRFKLSLARFTVLAMLSLALAAPLVLIACATQGGGQTDPILSQLIPKTLYDNADILAGNATQSCNAGAAAEYNANMVICNNPTAFVAQLPPIPLSTITPAQIASAISAVCAVNSYVPSKSANVAVGNCIFPAPSASLPKLRD
jgi:hypothetical protein